jgi:hypothetical protein
MEDSKYLRDLLAQLHDERLPQLDFDRLGEQLTEILGRIEEMVSWRQSAELLRQDYEARIAGMLKGIAAVERKRDSLAEALRVIENLSSLSCEELLACYRRTTARFRDTFPASFGYLKSSDAVRREKLAAYKS